MRVMTSQITSLTVVYSTDCLRNIKAPYHWHLCGEFTGDRWVPAQNPVTQKIFPFDDVIMINTDDALHIVFDENMSAFQI